MRTDDLSTRESLRLTVRTATDSVRDAARYATSWLVLCSVLTIAQAFLPGAQVVLLQQLINALTSSDQAPLWGPLLGLTAVVGLMYPMGQVYLASTHRMALRLRLRYRSDLAFAIARLAPSRIARPDVGAALTASQTATGAIDHVAGKVLQVVGAGITSTVLCAVVWRIDPVAGLLIVAALLPTVLAFTVIARMEAREWPAVATFERAAEYATEQLVQQRPATELAVLGSGPKVAATVAARRGEAMRVLDRMIGTAMRMELVAALGTAVIFGAALVALVTGGATGADAAAAVAGAISGLNAIRLCGYAVGVIITATPQATIYRDFLATARPAEPQSVTREAASVRLEHVSYTYPGAAEPALKDVSIHANRGELIALVGVNGAGKTTLINVLVGLLTADEGRVLIGGTDADELTETERLGYVGLLVQEFGRFEFSLRDVVALGRPGPVTDDEVYRALSSAEAEVFTRRLRLDDQLGQQWGGTGISGGQWQRLALARIYLRDAAVWILDEPTSAVDAEAEREIFAGLRGSGADRITIVVSHRAWTLREMDRIYVIDDGAVVEQGTYASLLADQGSRFAAIFTDQELEVERGAARSR
ncbi:ATP-binding cassette subfamily B protein [Kribbella amoyensis]|uniref:ATP-binding cassette subfamily B protein n=1 Tax=Kribbella amoyensis TaxID=996641 RepID=A0A561BXH3_9ACTN|nr:ABC transporter ATP-binding protein [Kribbella amoyensis]TWD83553.1 ATP-binding cassette subfamily B protein [Kribbella amoyensis]